ncbi:SAV_2336 N-terminal domain-related protein [Streptomyces sp. NPDC059650]|uniref:SAV_2336 N-terminal domain-related protein n=1 Tax=Streptomyces sp. NPDC059650 TaxID=3346896 RepID=UPI0036AE7DC6
MPTPPAPAGRPAGPPAGPPAPAGRHAPAPPEIRDLAGLLRAAGLDPSAEELADALWLAGRIGPPAPAAAPAGAARPPRRPAPRDQPPPEEGPPPAVHPPEDPVRLYAARLRGAAAEDPAALPGGAGVPVRVPGAAALPRILEIQRALRSLQRHRPPGPPTRLVLDEPATAEASARALGLVIPVLRPESRREATVRLVMDTSPSMAVWQDMFEELRGVCERLGAFRDVQVHYLHRLADGRAALGQASAPGTRLRSGDQLRDPSGRSLTMVVSDCAGPLWREGEAQRVLHRWAECTPCVVVQPLPQRLWNRSWLPTERGTLTRVEGGAGKLRFRPDRPARPGRLRGGLTVPVLPPNATALGAWARLVAGFGTGPVPAEVGRVLADHPAAPLPPPRAVRPPRELVRRFYSSASPRAVQLAVYLSAAPLTLPVMRLVQRTMLPDSEPSDLAEVLLSGLLRRGPAPGEWYEFTPGVQDVLLGPLGRDEAALVLKHCSEYVLAHFGRGVRNFPALAASQLTGEPVVEEGGDERVPAAPLPQAFAEVSARVVRRYLPGPAQQDTAGPEPAAPPPGRGWAVRTARDRLAAQDRLGGDGAQRGLYEAVAVLRRALAAPAGPDDPAGEAECELAGALLRLWARQRDPELLAEAEQAVGALHTAPARALRGRVLYERARAAPAERPDAELLTAELLAAAEREFAAAAAAPDGDARLRLDCTVRQARALVALGELRDDPIPLLQARAVLEALAGSGAGPGTGAAPGVLRPALGRVLLALLPRTPDPVERTALAEQAAGHLASGLPETAGGAGADALPGRGPAAGADPGGAGPAGPAPGPSRDAVGAGAAVAGTAGPAGTGAGPSGAEVPVRASGRPVAAGSGPGTAESDGPAPGPGRDRAGTARLRVDLATALRYLPARLEEASGQLARALAEADGDPELRLAALVCLARLHRARSARDADPTALEDAADAYGRARRLIPRDAEAYAELLPEWGDVLLERARAAGGRRFTSAAVRVLRDSRAAVPQSDARSAHRLVRLAAGLRLRHGYEGDVVDLREAEYLLELAVRHSRSPLEQARAWREHGDVQQEIHAHTRALDRLDRAADSYRRAWRAALEADRADRREVAVEIAARVQELRGGVLERLARPRAALDAYRSALELWRGLGEAAADRREALASRVRTLEAGL